MIIKIYILKIYYNRTIHFLPHLDENSSNLSRILRIICTYSPLYQYPYYGIKLMSLQEQIPILNQIVTTADGLDLNNQLATQ